MLSLAWRRGAPSGWKTHRVQNAPGSVGEAGHRGCFWSVLKAETCDQRGAVGSEADVQLHRPADVIKKKRLSCILSLNIDYPSVNHRNMQRTETKSCEEQTLSVNAAQRCVKVYASRCILTYLHFHTCQRESE